MAHVIVIGGGPGGYVAAIRAAQLGAQVTLVERADLGGTCLNVGCIPTKALLHSAELYAAVRNGAELGVLAEPKLDFERVQAHKASVTKKLVGGVAGLLRANKVKVVAGEARFTGPRTLEITKPDGKETLTGDKIIIATGSIPAAPPIPGLDGERCIDSTKALALGAAPKSMVIIGGGVIGVEMATVYSSFGAKITIVEMLPRILPMIDAQAVDVVKKELEKQGVTILTSAKVLSVAERDGAAHVQVEMDGRAVEVAGEKVLVSIGRRADTAALCLEKAGIAHDRGRITVNDRMETNVPGVYAIGDCIGRTMLAHVASAQGEVAAENAMGHDALYDESTNPSCVYTSPELASVGITEEQAKEKGIPYTVGVFPLMANGKSLIMNGGLGMIKIVAGARFHNVLGVHMVGPRATDLIAEAALAIRLEATTEEIISTIHAHPTVGEAMREAALAVEKRAIHIVN